MIELALLAGLGAVGYMLAVDQPQKTTTEGFAMSARPVAQIHSDELQYSQDSKGHGNEVPFFGPRVTQSMYSGGTDQLLDTHTGAGKEYFQKREVQSMYDAKPGNGNPFGAQVETDFMQSRMVSGSRVNNVFPIEPVRVGPGANDGYTNLGKGGFQQDQTREYALPKTTDELRVTTNPKLTYSEPVIPGQAKVTNPGIQATVNKNKPDRFAVLGMDRANTAVGIQTAPRIYSEQPMKTQARETTDGEYMGNITAGSGQFSSYIRAFTEPYQEFMKLTAEGRPGPAGGSSNEAVFGVEHYSAQTKRDESVLSDATRFNVPMQATTSHTEHMGSYRYNEPLKQDVNVSRNSSDILDAFHKNPYTQSLNAI